jgi:hypothetical protein
MATIIGAGITLGAGISLTPPPPSIVTDGLVLHYDFSNLASYPGSGTTITDLSASNNTGTVSNDMDIYLMSAMDKPVILIGRPLWEPTVLEVAYSQLNKIPIKTLPWCSNQTLETALADYLP